MPSGSWDNFPKPLKTAIMKNWTAISGSASVILAKVSTHHHADIVGAGRALKQAEAIGAASQKMKRSRAIAPTEAREWAAAADSASREATLFPSLTGEALQAARVETPCGIISTSAPGGNQPTPPQLQPLRPFPFQPPDTAPRSLLPQL